MGVFIFIETGTHHKAYLIQLILASLGIEYGGFISIKEEVTGGNKPVSAWFRLEMAFWTSDFLAYRCFPDHMPQGLWAPYPEVGPGRLASW